MSDAKDIPEDDAEKQKDKEKRRLTIAVLIVVLVIVLFVLAILIALLVISDQKHKCLHREAERKRIDELPELTTNSMPESVMTTMTAAPWVLTSSPVIGTECSGVPEINQTLIEEMGDITALDVAWKRHGSLTGLQLNHGDVKGELFGGTKIDSYVIGEDEEMVEFTLWEISGRMTAFQLRTRDGQGLERVLGPFGGHQSPDVYRHTPVDIPGSVLFLSGLWDEERIVNVYIHYDCARPSPNETIGLVSQVCEKSAVGNPSGLPLNTFNDLNVSKNGRITALKVIHGTYVNSLEVTYGDVSAVHGEWVTDRVNLDRDRTISRVNLWFGAVLSAMSVVLIEGRDGIIEGPFGTTELGMDVQENYGIDGLGESTFFCEDACDLHYISGSTSADGFIQSLQFHYFSGLEKAPVFEPGELCDSEAMTPVNAYTDVSINGTQPQTPERYCAFDDLNYREVGGRITKVEVTTTSGSPPTVGLRLTYGALMAPAHGDAWSGINRASFTLRPDDVIHSVSVWRTLAGDEYEGNVRALEFQVRRGRVSRKYGPYGTTNGNMTSLYVGRLEYVSGVSGDRGAGQAPLQLRLHFPCSVD